ncbi:hypothetical protein [Comamonas sp. 23]|jgi:hypothetical protein|uniref:hypothetical protein n=1 Tax=Comamonas sp. 23 TaxID=3415008 RepID=UPI003C702682
MLASTPPERPHLCINLKGFIAMEHEHKLLVVTDEVVSQTSLGEGLIEVDPSGSGVDEQDDARMHQQALRRFRPIQLWICLLFFVEGVLGVFVVGWPALILCILGILYMAWVAKRSNAPASEDMNQGHMYGGDARLPTTRWRP